ncbi:MAG: P-II family nitrogen regulator [Erysipelotrichaceae bacterium]|jgi:nitrogen regulatory protein PII
MVKLVLNYIIVNQGNGSKVLSYAKSLGLKGGTILLAHGTINNSLLKLLNLNENKKDVLLIAEILEYGTSKLKDIADYFQFEKPNYGVGFNICINQMVKKEMRYSEGDEIMNKYELIYAIVNKGFGEDVVDAASKAGSSGATIINARGSSVHETSKIFSIEIEPEKEIVLMIVQSDMKDQICQAIIKDTHITEPGKGVLFTQSINEVYGLYQDNN